MVAATAFLSINLWTGAPLIALCVLSSWPRVRCCYEAGPTGYGLARHLRGRGIACDVIAPGLVPVRPGDRVKTDPRDARKLARLHAGGLLEAIAVPSEELEALRDLVRAREAARVDRMRDRHRVSKFLLRHGMRMPNKSWGVTRRGWLGSLAFKHVHQQLAFESYLHALDLVDRRIEGLEAELHRAAVEGPWRAASPLRGIDTLSALGLVAEIGLDWSRFTTAKQFMSFVGLVPSERSSGEQRSQGSITKAGNTHVRRLLVEAAWHQRQGLGSARSSPLVSAGRTRACSSAPGVLNSAFTAAGAGWPPAASPTRRSSSRPPASSPDSSGRSRQTNRSGTPERQLTALAGWSSGCAQPHGEPRRWR
jgi:transposase